jgi:uncharacterized protein YlaI
MEYRLAIRDVYCRGCDKTLKRDKDMIMAMYSIRNRGQYIYFCKDCVLKMNVLVKDFEKS